MQEKLFLPMALSCLELWPGLGVVSRACQAGWLAMLPRGRWRGVRVQLNQRCIGVFWAENFLHFCVIVVQKILKINQNAEKKLYGGTMVEPCHLYPWISIQDFRCMTGPGVSCVYFCVTCVAACLLVGPACKNQFWGGAAESWKPEALRKLQMCHLSRSLDCLYILW